MQPFLNLALALAIGFLVGIERGWQMREAAEGSRIAGIRTFGLIGLLGGLWALLGEQFGELVLGIAFATMASLLLIARLRGPAAERDRGATTEVAAMVTFALGALAVREYQAVAAAAAVITTLLLSLKPVLHGWLRRLEARELYAILKLLLISVVLLPVLPDRGYGPGAALNPYEIWWMVVLIAGISFVGYFAMRVAGTRRGLLLTGLFGGLASSTATTLNFARLGRHRPALHRVLLVGVLLASATMFPRILLEVAVVNPALLGPLIAPLGLMVLGAALAGGWYWRNQQDIGDTGELPYRNPFELVPALQFGLILVAVMLLAEALRTRFGEVGLYLLAAISGLSDVDAITLSLARMARADLPASVGTRAIVLAAMVNTVVKAVLVISISGWSMGLRLMGAVALVLALGAVGLVAG
ncbi:MAG: MgtC/SapB family protein [Gammaproteobacteria bacterium]|nr:MgtC/SapB family protein [Gammaproteobacteria bacterium]NIR97948.1 MgtC/SapB family protein [Gammaproteobacteria bacterium]NIT63649.1 MgtC/SapB family protein [Gammaproteobacteria bacterium]NIV20589.1 DUF4010 domain-containing protein [Gammaproteobacteria bacterium]NIX11187.1 DUF4010 domain-containing protein [Gammaproteobacteria bacterium]